MVKYRQFRNTDPPSLVEVWNAALTGRSAGLMKHSSALEYQVFSRSYFDPRGLIVAEDDDKIIGFGHAGFGPIASESAIDHEIGVICMLLVQPEHQKKGIGTELLNRCESYLAEEGAKKILAGSCPPNDPFYQQLYGGCEPPGILDSDRSIVHLLEKRGYTAGHTTIVLQKKLINPPTVTDSRFVGLRQQYDIYAGDMGARSTWWKNCELAAIEPMEFTLQVGEKGEPVAEALVVELEWFSLRWNQPSVGLLSLEVQEEHRRKGLGKYLLTQILYFLQERCYAIAEVQVPEENESALSLCKGLGFEQVDVGRVYVK